MKLKCDERLSNFAVNFNLRHHATGCFDFVLDDSELRAYVFSKHATISGTPATLTLAATAAADDNIDNVTAIGAFDGVYMKSNATVLQVAAYTDEQCGSSGGVEQLQRSQPPAEAHDASA